MYYYRLKPNAVPFFRNNLKTAVLDWDTWTKTYNVDHEAIERVEPCYLTYGHESTIPYEQRVISYVNELQHAFKECGIEKDFVL